MATWPVSPHLEKANDFIRTIQNSYSEKQSYSVKYMIYLNFMQQWIPHPRLLLQCSRVLWHEAIFCLHQSQELSSKGSTHINHCICQNHHTSNSKVVCLGLFFFFLLSGFACSNASCLQFNLVLKVVSFNSSAPCFPSPSSTEGNLGGGEENRSGTCCFWYRPAFKN